MICSPLMLSTSHFVRAHGHQHPHLTGFVARCSVCCDPPPPGDVALEELKPPFHPLTTGHPLPLGLHPASYRHKLSSFPHVPATFCASARTLTNIYYIVFFFRSVSCVRSYFILREPFAYHIVGYQIRSRNEKRRPDTSDEKLPELLLPGSRSCQVASRSSGWFC